MADLMRQIRLEALANVLVKGFADRDYMLRKANRWYSKTFHTPLADVEKLPVYLILRAYTEEQFEAMSEENLELARAELCMTDAEREEARLKEALDEVDDERFFKEVEAEEQARIAAMNRRAAGLPVEPVKRGPMGATTQAPQRPSIDAGYAREVSLDGLSDHVPFKVEFVDDLFPEDKEG